MISMVSDANKNCPRQNGIDILDNRIRQERPVRIEYGHQFTRKLCEELERQNARSEEQGKACAER
jgi:hypothetical protein